MSPDVKLVELTPETTIDDVTGTIPFATVLSGIATGVEFVNVKFVVVVPVELRLTVAPWQITVSVVAAVTVITDGCVMMAESFTVQLFASDTVTVYVPAVRLVVAAVVVPLLHE
jgi:hypothetical protein